MGPLTEWPFKVCINLEQADKPSILIMTLPNNGACPPPPPHRWVVRHEKPFVRCCWWYYVELCSCSVSTQKVLQLILEEIAKMIFNNNGAPAPYSLWDIVPMVTRSCEDVLHITTTTTKRMHVNQQLRVAHIVRWGVIAAATFFWIVKHPSDGKSLLKVVVNCVVEFWCNFAHYEAIKLIINNKVFPRCYNQVAEELEKLGLASVLALHDTKNENEQNQRKSEDWHSCSAKKTALRRKKLTMTSSNVTSFPLWEVDVEQ